MNLKDEKYSQYALVREMMDTIGVVKNFDPSQTKTVAPKIQSVGRLLMTGEGSSRLFHFSRIIILQIEAAKLTIYRISSPDSV